MCRFVLKLIQLLLFILVIGISTRAQNCPANIDFESGAFNGWDCYTGTTLASGNQNIISIANSGGPVGNRHTMIPAVQGGLDPYGHFPVNCPNGSGYSIKLGNDQAGTEAEGISYQFTIPSNRNEFSLIYHYAVVFQDPGHQPQEQPRFVVEIMNLTDNELIHCSSFTFFAVGTLLPGFFLSPNPPDNTPVWCKDWSAVSINLDGLAGKSIQLFFKTADCTFRRHFGYAYIDVNSECSGEFVGAAYCPDDTLVNVVAPYGYQNYTWFNQDFSQILGDQPVLTLAPPPPPGTTIAVQVIPYHGYGCLDTLYARLIDTLTVTANAGIDAASCNGSPVRIGAPPRPGIVYRWYPAIGLSDPFASNPFASPLTSTTYILSAMSSGGGCLDTDTVLVNADNIDNAMTTTGSTLYCIDSGDSTILSVLAADHIQWYRNNTFLPGANQRNFRVIQSGIYHAVLTNNSGCSISTRAEEITIEEPKPGINYPVEFALENYPLPLKARTIGVSALWSPPIYLSSTSGFTPVFNGPFEQLYTIEITTMAGCVTVDTQVVKTVKNVEILVPKAFTPNSDGRNDYLRPILMGVKQLNYFKIFNRWGQVIFETRNDQPGWDGRLKGVLQSSQVFVWVAEGVGVDNRIYLKKGTSVLIR